MIKKLNSHKAYAENGIFHLSDLKIIKNIQSEQFYFELKKEYREKLFEAALSTSKNIRNLSKNTHINYWNLWDCIKRTPISLTNLKKLSEFLIKNGFLEFSLEEIEKNIESIQKMFGLTDKEKNYCLFRFINTSWRRPKDFFEDFLNCSEFKGRQYILAILNITSRDLNAIRSGTLAKIGMINFDYSEEIEDEFLELFQNPNSKTVSKNFYSKLPQKCLPLKYHMIDHEKTDYVLALLKDKPKSSTHIILYGQAGTGKTSSSTGES